MRLAAPIAIAALAAALLGGCGGGSGEGSTGTGGATAPIGATAHSCETRAVDAQGLRATGISCAQARQVMFGWQRDSDCVATGSASHSACTRRSYRCIATKTERGLAVSCSRSGGSVAFTARRE
jgi:hypothetical protein